ECGRGLIIGLPGATDAALKALDVPAPRSTDQPSPDGSDTILLDKIEHIDLELVICGLALPNVPLADVVAGYSYDLLPDGTWATRSDEGILRVSVNENGVAIQPLAPQISVGGNILNSQERFELTDHATIETPAGSVQFYPTKAGYLGMLLNAGTKKLGIRNGQTAEIGRKPNPPGLAFPNRDGQENIRWCSGARAAQAKREDFSLDRVLAGRQQAAIKASRGAIELHPLHDDCATFVYREGRIGRAKRAVRIRIGDLLVAGTNVVAVRAPE
ncbi:MAG: hypothetical protein AAF493_28865, partial [Pseudomonadota bacterium]